MDTTADEDDVDNRPSGCDFVTCPQLPQRLGQPLRACPQCPQALRLYRQIPNFEGGYSSNRATTEHL